MAPDPGYDAAFFRYVNATATASALAILPLLVAGLKPASVLDVGCGQGAWLAIWRRLGITDSRGLDGDYVDRAHLLVPPECFTAHDLARPFDLGRRFSLVQCLEVAEHLPKTSAEGLLDSLTRHADCIFFSAAPPGQGGHDHLNERRYDDWRADFARRDFLALDYLRPRIRGDAGIAPWYRYNPLLYVRRSALAGLAGDVRASLLPEGTPVPDVSPLAYRLRKQVVRRLPVPIMTALARAKERLERSRRSARPP